jgi:hypothetical protein
MYPLELRACDFCSSNFKSLKVIFFFFFFAMSFYKVNKFFYKGITLIRNPIRNKLFRSPSGVVIFERIDYNRL